MIAALEQHEPELSAYLEQEVARHLAEIDDVCARGEYAWLVLGLPTPSESVEEDGTYQDMLMGLGWDGSTPAVLVDTTYVTLLAHRLRDVRGADVAAFDHFLSKPPSRLNPRLGVMTPRSPFPLLVAMRKTHLQAVG